MVTCGCVDDVSFKDSKLCTLENSRGRNCVDDLKASFSPINDCNCPNECHSVSYDVIVTSLDWPTERSFPRFLASINEAFDSLLAQQFILKALNKYQEERNKLDNQAITAVRDTFGKLNVYFSDISETFVEERPVYNLVSVVSNLGGLLGLYLGFSVMTLLEVADFFFDLVEYFNLKGKSVRFYKTVVTLKKALRKSLRKRDDTKLDEAIRNIPNQNLPKADFLS